MSTYVGKRNRNKPWRAEVKIEGMEKISKSFHTKSEAKDWAHKTEATLMASRFTPGLLAKERTVGEAIEIYIRDELPKKSENSQQQTRNRLDEWKARLGTMRMIEVTGTKVFNILDRQQNQGPTKNRKLGTLSAVMTHFTKAPNQWLTHNPCHDVSRWPENDNRTGTFKPDEWTLIMAAATKFAKSASAISHAQRQMPLYLRFLYETGVRRAESRRIEVTDIDWYDNTVKIKGKDRDKRTGLPVIRWSVISDELAADLKAEIDQRSDDCKWLWQGRNGKPCTFDNHFKIIRKQCDLYRDDLGFHAIRHTAITEMSEQTQDIYTLKQFSGHKTTAMLDVYVNPDAKDGAKAAARLRAAGARS